jgi:hypothetical protein
MKTVMPTQAVKEEDRQDSGELQVASQDSGELQVSSGEFRVENHSAPTG